MKSSSAYRLPYQHVAREEEQASASRGMAKTYLAYMAACRNVGLVAEMWREKEMTVMKICGERRGVKHKPVSNVAETQ